MQDEPVVCFGTYYWQLTAYKDGVIWDVTNASITHYFWTPSNDIKSYTMSVIDGPNGISYHINPTDTFDIKGEWYHSYKVSLSGIVVESAPEKFTVYRSLAGLV